MESENEVIDPAAHRPNHRRLVITGAVAAIVLSVVVIARVVPDLHKGAQSNEDRDRAAKEPAHVEVVLPHRQSDNGKIALPGTVQAVQEAVVNARSTGY